MRSFWFRNFACENCPRGRNDEGARERRDVSMRGCEDPGDVTMRGCEARGRNDEDPLAGYGRLTLHREVRRETAGRNLCLLATLGACDRLRVVYGRSSRAERLEASWPFFIFYKFRKSKF